MGGGIQWLVDQDDWRHCVVFARGITPEELGLRMGGVPGSVVSPITDIEAWDMVLDLATDDDDVVRVGARGGWSFAVEYGLGDGGERLADVSRSGVEVVHLNPSVDHPPAMFSYARDGVDVCRFGIGEEVWRWGEQPDLLLPELVAAGVLHPDGEYARPDSESYRDRDRHTLALIEIRFGLSLPRDEVENERLPAFVIG
ncbi:DUF6461 domain-containing protein [Streptomyces sp. NBC_00038]|uniref:DUF6461 domain-containing protein n=1 Tax=Streptomyces sp. NBC_00038 TaxID=2903615 RepID=UPI0022530D6B|nr:DUF6461 domain-containing protein [Streptomyces sp. NBC_00038]MCX5554845.1 DUF6461 domain-containing protein [Streptomyces sp. NBC_00038]